VEAARFRALCNAWVFTQAWVFKQTPNFGRPESATAVVNSFRENLAKAPGFKACWDEMKQFTDAYGYGSFVRAIGDAEAPPVPPPSPVRPITRDDETRK
jgi:hypothetical protein